MSSFQSEENKRIAKNTLFLYFRQILTMLVSLYTVRVVLKVLGVQDYGIYNVVGGIVTMFGFLNGTMSSATQRYLSFYMVRDDGEELNKIFSVSLQAYIGILILIVFMAETIGLWFLNTKMSIPEARLVAANVVYQFSILSFIMTIVATPFNAAIIAHEHMNIFAYIGILDVFLKLFVICILQYFDFSDSLILYSILICFSVLSYAWWNMLGALSSILKSNGINILINMFFGVTINASRAISYQIKSVLNNFVVNFSMALQPSMVKSYSSGNYNRTFFFIV